MAIRRDFLRESRPQLGEEQAQRWMQLGRVQTDRLDADAARQAFRAAGQQHGGAGNGWQPIDSKSVVDCTGVGYLEGAIAEGFQAGLAVG